MSKIMKILTTLRFVMNREKLEFLPSEIQEWLGFLVSQEKSSAKLFMKRNHSSLVYPYTARHPCECIINKTAKLQRKFYVEIGKFHYRLIERIKSLITTIKGNMDKIIILNPKNKACILWWKTIFWIVFQPYYKQIQHITPAQMPHLSSQMHYLIMRNIVGISNLKRGEYI